jgi:hypothetical protein
MTRMQLQYKLLSKDKIKERAAAAVDQRNLTATVSITDIAAEVENDRRESVMKLSQAHNVSAKTVHPLFTRICHSQEVGRLSYQIALHM